MGSWFDSEGQLIEPGRAIRKPPSLWFEVIVLPFFKAGITCAGFGALTWAVAILYNYPMDTAMRMGRVGGLVAFLVVWCWPRIDNTPPMPAPAPTERKAGNVVLLKQNMTASPPTEGERLANFVEACEHDTNLRRLEKLGYSRKDIERWRDWLIGQNWAAWKNEQAHGQGWELIEPVETILDGMV